MTKTEKKQRASDVEKVLVQKYPSAECALKYEGDPWRLLVMGRLSAQCTDARVNIVCVDLFRRYPDAVSMADAELADVEKRIRSCGLYHTKAQSLIGMSQMIVKDFGGKVPDTMEDLLKLPGVGRKIANLILGDVYGRPAIVADTHCIRISNRLGLCSSPEPEKVEMTLKELVNPETSSDFCHRLVMFGRDVCRARNPECGTCPFREYNCKK